MELGNTIAELRSRQEELHVALDAPTIQPPTRQELADLAQQVRIALQEGPTPACKLLLRTLVHEIQVEGRHKIIPVFRVPGGGPPAPRRGVRTMYRSVAGTPWGVRSRLVMLPARIHGSVRRAGHADATCP
jgi:hypothetical protein